MDFYTSFNFLYYNKIVYHEPVSFFSDALNIKIIKVNPDNNYIEIGDKSNLNTKTMVCLEFGPVKICKETGEKIVSHDYDLDVRMDSFEEAIVKLALAVKYKYEN